MGYRTLFLDDNHARHRDMQGRMLFDPAFTASECIEKLKNNKYDVVFLDHDLGGKEMVSSFSDEETGCTVAKWISENKPEIPVVVCHSLNPGGADNMASILVESGYLVVKQKFITLGAPGILEKIFELATKAE